MLQVSEEERTHSRGEDRHSEMQSPFRDTEVFTDDMIGCLGFASKGTKREGSGWTCVRGQDWHERRVSGAWGGGA